jgi:DMSO/TMAO reductase YedYZ heme-binding membrane subunit
MTNETKQKTQSPRIKISPLDGMTRWLIRVCASVALFGAMVFFVYSAYSGAVLGKGSSEVFTGVACLLLVLISCIMIERIVLKNSTIDAGSLDVK